LYGRQDAFCVNPILLHGVELQYDLLYLRGFLYSFSRRNSFRTLLIKSSFILINIMKQENESGCKSCKDKGKSRINWMIALSAYVTITSIYGNIIIFNKLINYLKDLF